MYWHNEVEGGVNDILLSIIGKLVGDIPLSGRHTGEELQRVQIDRH